MTNKIEFQVFGSSSSQDLDCMCFVERIPSIKESHELCERYAEYIQEVTQTDKEINTNICVVKDRRVVDTFKGTADEVNNSLYLTRDLHRQYNRSPIERLVERDVELKILRTARVLLSFWSRSKHRPLVKKALKGDIYEKIEAISSIDITEIDFNKNINQKDYLKTLAFQLGQTIGLIEGKAFYTKEGMLSRFYDLEKYLMREEVNSLSILENYKKEFISLIKDRDFKITREPT